MKTYYRSMTPMLAEKIRTLYFKERRKQVDIAKEFNIAQGSVSRIISNKVWSES